MVWKELKDELTAKLVSGMDEQYATLAMPAEDLIDYEFTWNGSDEVAVMSAADVLVLGDFIKLNSDGRWYRVYFIGSDMVTVEDIYHDPAAFPSGDTGTSKARIAPPAPLSASPEAMDPFSQGIAAAIAAAPHQLPVTVKTDLPPATPAGRMIYVTNDVGGAVPAFSDGVNWRRVTDRAIIS